MKEINLTTKVRSVAYEELSADDRRLVDAAKKATMGAYAPYSRFFVGAAILLDNGEIVVGANQENAAFSSGTCAERSACFHAGAVYPNVPFRKIAIAAYTDGDFQRLPISPCGACRQSLLEYETLHEAPIQLILYGKEEIYILESVASLLPLCFTEF
jgi:cytidine deaminase